MRKSYLTALVGMVLGLACMVVAVSPASLCRAACSRTQACVAGSHAGACPQQQPAKTPQSVLWGNGVGKAKPSKVAPNPIPNAQTGAK